MGTSFTSSVAKRACLIRFCMGDGQGRLISTGQVEKSPVCRAPSLPIALVSSLLFAPHLQVPPTRCGSRRQNASPVAECDGFDARDLWLGFAVWQKNCSPGHLPHTNHNATDLPFCHQPAQAPQRGFIDSSGVSRIRAPAMPRKLCLPVAIFSISTVGIIRAHSASIYGRITLLTRQTSARARREGKDSDNDALNDWEILPSSTIDTQV
jgi:hypothetical protein